MDCQATSHFSVSQCDFPSITGPISPAPIDVGVLCPAKRLLSQQSKAWPSRCSPGLKRSPSWPGNTSQQEVPRSTGSHREEALSEAFAPSSKADDVLFYLPVTRLTAATGPGLVFICHSSTRAWSNCCATSSIFGSPWDRAQHRA